MDLRRIEEDREASLVFWEMEPRTFDVTQGAAALAEWLHDMETIFRLCHVRAHLQVMLASRRLMGEARVWWLSLGDPGVPTDVWRNFRYLIILRYGPLPGEGFDVHHRDPEIYADMHRRQYASYVATWQAYPNESMGHYCQRFRDAILPYIPPGTHLVQTLSILRGGLPLEIMQFTPIATPEMTFDDMVEAIMDAEITAYWVRTMLGFPAPMFEKDPLFVPMDDASMGEPLFHGGPFMLEDPILAVPIQEIPPQEDNADDVEMDPDDQLADPEEDPEDPPMINIASDDEKEIEEVAEEADEEEFEDDPEEVLFQDEEWDVFSNVTTE
ncbi:hypothetical protein TIFTF001_049943 [Ficus carica]|uniref:Retrotransposon gag domain-containing protein n=1 Tax=Ficus carica TaxID=3494 RepID=A0AA87YV69_FICCA|nr:hypothetical protein TIFTF001_049940 [Ficus carica]GMN19729.1 hypothetical protein TIFTF001_049943 [Ficus carica]